MNIKNAGYDDELWVSNRLWGSNWNKDYVQVEIDDIIDYNDIGGDNGGFGKEMGGGSFVRAPSNLKKYSGAIISNAPVSLDGGNVRLKF